MVCQTMDQAQVKVSDYDDIERITGLASAAAILSHQLMMRQTSKPATKRQLAEVRKAQEQWRAAREILARPAEGQA
jgi:hypothetical protein